MPGPGARQLVAAVPRQAPIYSLLTAADIVPPDVSGDGHWRNGIKYRREPCGRASVLPLGCPSDDDLDDITVDDATEADNTAGEVATDPFLVKVYETCSTLGWPTNDYVGRAQRVLAASEAYAVEHEFWTGEQAQVAIGAGVDYPDDQWLANSTSATVLSGSANPLGYGLAQLQQAMADVAGGGPGMIHIPAVLLNPLVELMLVTPLPANGTTPPRYVDVRGNIIVPGFGYDGSDVNGDPADAGTVWIYGTGMVRIYRGDPVVTPDTYAEALDRFHNEITFFVERDYLVDWDRCIHIAINVGVDLDMDKPAA